MFRVMGSMMPYRNRAYDIYRKNFSEASAIGFLSAILFTVFCEPVKNLVDFGEKWMELSGLPFQMNIALLGFVAGYGTVRILQLMRIQVFRMLLNYTDWMFNPKSTTTKVGCCQVLVYIFYTSGGFAWLQPQIVSDTSRFGRGSFWHIFVGRFCTMPHPPNGPHNSKYFAM